MCRQYTASRASWSWGGKKQPTNIQSSAMGREVLMPATTTRSAGAVGHSLTLLLLPLDGATETAAAAGCEACLPLVPRAASRASNSCMSCSSICWARAPATVVVTTTMTVGVSTMHPDGQVSDRGRHYRATRDALACIDRTMRRSGPRTANKQDSLPHTHSPRSCSSGASVAAAVAAAAAAGFLDIVVAVAWLPLAMAACAGCLRSAWRGGWEL